MDDVINNLRERGLPNIADSYNEYIEKLSVGEVDRKSLNNRFIKFEQDILDLHDTVEQYLSRKRWAILYIYDGLDNYSRSAHTREKFLLRVKEVIDILIRGDGLKNAYILVMRDESFNFMKTRKEASKRSEDYFNLYLVPVKIRDVFVCKGLLTQEVNKGKSIYEDNRCKKIIENPRTFSEFVFEFMANFLILHQSQCKIPNELYSNCPVNQFFGNNVRLAIEGLNVLAQDIIKRIEVIAVADSSGQLPKKESDQLVQQEVELYMELPDRRSSFIDAYHYIVPISLMLNKSKFSMPRYSVSPHNEYDARGFVDHDNDHRKCRLSITVNARHEEKEIIPNIYRIPDPARCYESLEEYQGKNEYLIKLRILQYIHLNSREGAYPNYHKICKFFESSLKYNARLIWGVIRLLYAEQCIKIVTKDLSRDTETIEPWDNWSTTTMGTALAGGFAYTYDYLACCIENMHFDRILLNVVCMDPVSYVKEDYRAIRRRKGYRNSFAEVLATKMKCTLYTASYLYILERHEYSNLSEEYAQDPFFIESRIGWKLIDNVTRSITMIVGSKSKFVREHLIKKLDWIDGL